MLARGVVPELVPDELVAWPRRRVAAMQRGDILVPLMEQPQQLFRYAGRFAVMEQRAGPLDVEQDAAIMTSQAKRGVTMRTLYRAPRAWRSERCCSQDASSSWRVGSIWSWDWTRHDLSSASWRSGRHWSEKE